MHTVHKVLCYWFQKSSKENSKMLSYSNKNRVITSNMKTTTILLSQALVMKRRKPHTDRDTVYTVVKI